MPEPMSKTIQQAAQAAASAVKKPQEQTTEPEVHPELKAKLDQIQAGVQQQQQFQQILQNPQINQALQLLNSGKKIKIVEEGQEPPQSVPSPAAANLDAMDNKELVQYMEQRLLAQVETALQKNLSPLMNRQELIAKHLESEQLNRQITEIDAFKKTVKDFDSLVPDILEVRKNNPALSVDEYYLIAKKRKLGTAAFADTFSERPTQESTPPPEIETQTFERGRRGLTDLVGLGVQHAFRSVKPGSESEL